VRNYLKENPELAQNIEAQIREAMFPKPEPAEASATAGEQEQA
jgi:hypothetical protein